MPNESRYPTSSFGSDKSFPPAGLPKLGPPFSWRYESGLAWVEFAYGGAKGVFSTRLGGISRDQYSSLNLGILTGDDGDRVARNRLKLCAAIGRPADSLVWGRQQHSAEVVRVSRRVSQRTRRPSPAGEDREPPPPVDGLVTTSTDVTPLVLAADCLPVALTAGGGVAMLHCGWRGICLGIIKRGTAELIKSTGCDSAQVSALIGPGIGACCYEVGSDVFTAMSSLGPMDDLYVAGMLDLARIVERELQGAGVPAIQIHSTGLCTSCLDELFFSHRRDNGRSGRQCGLVWRDW